MPPVTRKYRDLNLNFLIHPVTGDLVAITDVEAVKRSIRNLVMTNNYERYYNSDCGTGVAQFLFELAGPIVKHRIKTAIEDVITNYEPRAELISVDVELMLERNAYGVYIKFGVKNTTEPVTLNLFLERVR